MNPVRGSSAAGGDASCGDIRGGSWKATWQAKYNPRPAMQESIYDKP